jgi:hypothetical protein
MGSIPGARTGDGRFDGETSLGGLLIFFLGGAGEGKRRSRVRLAERFFAGRAGSKQPCLCYILYVEQWRFRCNMSSVHRERGFLDPRTPWADACDVSGLDSPSTCSHSDDRGGTTAFVPPRTPRNSGYDFFMHMRSMLLYVICPLYVICLLYV